MKNLPHHSRPAVSYVDQEIDDNADQDNLSNNGHSRTFDTVEFENIGKSL